MDYKVRNNKQDDGTYILSYGRGKKKLTATMYRSVGNGCIVSTGDGSRADTGVKPGFHVKMRDCRADWGAWAKKEYDGDVAESASLEDGQPSPSEVPASPARPGPPAHKASASPPKHQRKPSPENEYGCDPFDPAFHTKDDKNKFRLTPLGVLDEIYHWMGRHQHLVVTKGRLNLPWVHVAAVLRRELPDRDYKPLSKELADEQPPAEAHTDRTDRTDGLNPEALRDTIYPDGGGPVEEDNIPF